MALELDFEEGGDVSGPAAYVVLNQYSGSPVTGLPSLTPDCMSMSELEGQLSLIEGQIDQIRIQAKRRFLAAGISN